MLSALVLVGACLLVPTTAPAQAVPPLHTEEWKFDIVHRTRGRAPFRGLVVEQTRTDLIIKWVPRREPGRPTVVWEDRIPLSDVARVEMLGPKERKQLVERLEALERERAILRAQLPLQKGGRVEVPPSEALALKPVPCPWSKGGKGKALEYTSTYFRLVSNARADIVHLTAIQMEQVFTAYVRCLPPRDQTPRRITILLTQSLTEYGALVRERGYNILNPAFYDPANNQVVCGSDLERLSHELSKAREYHDKLRAELKSRRAELVRIYNRQVPPELLRPVDDSLNRIKLAQKKNSEVFKNSHGRFLQRLCHEAFHGYLAECVFGDKKMRVPPWLDEGLAQVFETALVDAGELRIGHADLARRDRFRTALQKGDLLSLATLLKASPRQFQVAHAEDKQASDKHYLVAWALAFYLTFDRQVLGTPAFDDYLKALQRGVEPLEAFQTLTGQSLTAFEKNFHDYLNHLRPDGSSTAPK
jgi:hypothetical protein